MSLNPHLDDTGAAAAAIAEAMVDVGRPLNVETAYRVAVRLLDSTWLEDIVDQAVRRGREDNSLHEECVVRGSRISDARDHRLIKAALDDVSTRIRTRPRHLPGTRLDFVSVTDLEEVLREVATDHRGR